MVRMTMLRSFCAVVEHRSFSRAATHLGITQPAVSQQLRRLEDAYGVELVHRRGAEAVLTEAGQAVYEYARQIVGLYERSLLASAETIEAHSGRLRVAASTGVGEAFLPLVLVAFSERVPGVRVDVRVGDSSAILTRLIREHLDLGFVGTLRQDRHLEFEHFWKDRLALVLSPTHPLARRSTLSLEEFLALPLVLQQSGSGATVALRDALGAHGLGLEELNVVSEVGLQESTKAMVSHGRVGTIISGLGVFRDLKDRRLVEIRVDGLELTHDFYIAYSKDWPLSRTARAFVDTARETLARLRAELL